VAVYPSVRAQVVLLSWGKATLAVLTQLRRQAEAVAVLLVLVVLAAVLAVLLVLVKTSHLMSAAHLQLVQSVVAVRKHSQTEQPTLGTVAFSAATVVQVSCS
jgi:hypothetical protein